MSSEFDRNPQIDPETFKPVTASSNKFKHKVGGATASQPEEPECTICHANATEGKRYSFIMSHKAAEGQDPAITRFMANNKTILKTEATIKIKNFFMGIALL